MDRRKFIGFSTAALASTQALPMRKLQAQGTGSGRPNFLVIVADDLTFRAIQSVNNPEVQTPNLDRLVRSGCTFTHCFHQGSWTGAVCVAKGTRQPETTSPKAESPSSSSPRILSA